MVFGEEKPKAPTLHDQLETEMSKLRAHPSGATLSPEHITKLLQLLIEAVK